MEIDDVLTQPEATEEDRRVSRRQLAQQAITFAMQSRWQDAVDANQQLIEAMPGDAEAFNRLGNAYTKLGQVADAREAYAGALKADPANLIAQRNLERLSHISETEAAELSRRAGRKLDPQFFMEETGKASVASLTAVAGRDLLATLAAGDEVQVEVQGADLVVLTEDGTRIGMVEDRLAARLTRLIQTGNQYRAGLVGVDGREVRIMIRETHQSPENAGRISFPPRVETLPRPYLREGLLRRAGDEEDEDEADVDLHDETVDDDDDDASEFGFHEGTLDES